MANPNDNAQKPVAQPHHDDQSGMSNPNQSSWGEGKAGEIMRRRPEAIPGEADQNEKK